jgi:hypothetical protein
MSFRVPLRPGQACEVPLYVHGARATRGHLAHRLVTLTSLRGESNSQKPFMTRKMANNFLSQPTYLDFGQKSSVPMKKVVQNHEFFEKK